MWNSPDRVPGSEQEDGRAGGEDRVHAPFQAMPVGRKQDVRRMFRPGNRTDRLGERNVRVLGGDIHPEYRRPVPHAPPETPLDPLQHTHLAANCEDQRSGDPPGKTLRACGKVPCNVVGVM